VVILRGCLPFGRCKPTPYRGYNGASMRTGRAPRAANPVRWGILVNPAAQPFHWTSAYAQRELAGCLRAQNLILRKHLRENRTSISLRRSPPTSHLSRWGRLAPDSQRRSPGPGDDCSNPSPRMPSAASIPGRRWARASDLKIRLFSWEVKGRFLVFHVKLFFENDLFHSRLLQEFESKCRKTVCGAIPRWPQRC